MNLEQFFNNLKSQGIQLRVMGNHLQIQSESEMIPPDIKAILDDFEEEIVLWLGGGDESPLGGLKLEFQYDPAGRYDPFPLSPLQRAYWVGRSGALALGDVGTHVYLELRCPELDISRLEAAWNRIIARHDMLRAIVTADGRQQVLAEVPAYSITAYSLPDSSPQEVEAHLATIRSEMDHQLLPVEHWPLFDIRATHLRRNADSEHASPQTLLHIGMDVFFCDFGSLLRVFEQWQHLYEEKPPEPPQAPSGPQFRDYILAEQALEHTSDFAKARDYWMARLPTFPRAPELPLARDPSQITQTRFHRRSAKVDANLWGRIKAQASERGLTANGILLAAFAEVLAYWSKNSAFALNLTFRSLQPIHPDVDRLFDQVVGDFTAISLLAIDCSGASPFEKRAQALQKTMWDDIQHRAFDGLRVLRELGRIRGESSGPLMPIVYTSGLGFNSTVGLEPFGEEVYGSSQTPQVWLDHVVIEKAGELKFSWNTVEDLFPPGLVADMFSAYCTLLERLALDPKTWQMVCPVSLPSYQQTLRDEVNATSAPISQELLHTLFLNQVDSNADRPAVIDSMRTLSYRELRDYANTLGHRLRALGARPGQLIAVLMEKGWEQVVAVFGILMSGAAYLPIDPTLPPERRNYLLDQGEVSFLLTQSRLSHQNALPEHIQVLGVDEVLPDASLALLPVVQTPEDLAYVIYTSGSTGMPKGVVIDHRGAVNTVLDINRRYRVGAEDRVLALSALTFDLSVYDIFGLLACGGAVVLPSPELRGDPAHWVELLVRHDITLWNTVPALLQMLVGYFGGDTSNHDTLRMIAPAQLRLAMLSGDWIPVTLPDQARQIWPKMEVHSMGGATEGSIWSIHYPIAQVDPAWPSIPYGKPLANQTFHVFDQNLQPRPTWVPGELYIGGIGVALGYWKDKAKTAERFLRDAQSGGRLYKTGDLGRYLPDGNIEFLGREDFQVKIRGYRVELGEIEAALLQHPDIKECVVDTVGNPKGHRQLVAYVVGPSAWTQQTATTQSNGPIIPDVHIPGDNTDTVSGLNLSNPIERMAFKLSEPGLRRDLGEIGVALPGNAFDDQRRSLYLSRQSHRRFLAEPLPLEKLGACLSCLAQMRLDGVPMPKYLYPSAGSLYPVQVYVHVKEGRVRDMAEGFYYYHPGRHELIAIDGKTPGSLDLSRLHVEANQIIAGHAAFSLFLVAEMRAIAPLYGRAARDFCLLEAGGISQLLMGQATHHHMGLCPIGILDERMIKDALDLNEHRILVHSLVGGEIDPACIGSWPQMPQDSAAHAKPAPAHWEETIQSYLAGKLPAYMVPSYFVALEKLPLGANGKVNRKALPAPHAGPKLDKLVAPENDMEAQLRTIVQEVLGHEHIGVTHNFFEMGADSVHLTQVLAKLHPIVERPILITELFKYPTIRALAQYLSRADEQTAHEIAAVADRRARAQSRRAARTQGRRSER